MELDFEHCYRAVASRDQRFDGRFVTAVTSTRIYCRPSCPAVTPKRPNVRFLPSAAAAQRAGFRACLRCRPDAAPGSPDWDVRADVVGRAMRLIGDGVVDREGVPGLARRLGYTERHLHRMLAVEVGAGPLALARAQRAHTARILVETTGLGLAEIAFAAGFGSVRQFNDTFREIYGVAPSRLRETARRAVPASGAATVTLRLPYRPPLHAEALFGFLAARAVPGVEEMEAMTYRRAVRLPHGTGTVALSPAPAPGPAYVSATLDLADLRDLSPAVARCRRLLDLDADPPATDAALAADPALAPLVVAEPGVRLPRTVDGFELAVRAVVGQQISVAAARRTLAKMVAALTPPAEPADHDSQPPANGSQPQGNGALHPFPGAELIIEAPDGALGMPAARRETVRAVAVAVVAGELDLDPGADRAETRRRLLDVPGIGPWTADYIALRALGDPDVFLASDLGVRRGARALGLPDTTTALQAHAARWAPWRSYATLRLWRVA